MGQIPFNGKDRKCPMCGKVFLLYEETWVYKRRLSHDSTKYFCSWHCLQKFEKEHPKPLAVEQREKLIELIKQGMGTSDIVRTLGVDRTKVRYWKERVGKVEDGV